MVMRAYASAACVYFLFQRVPAGAVLEEDAACGEIRRGCGRPRRSRGAGAPRGAPRSAARSRRPAPAAARPRRGAAPARRARGRTASNASRTAGTSPAPSSPASIAVLSARTRSNIAPSAAGGVEVVAACAAANAVARLGDPRGDRRVRARAVHRVEPREEVGQPPQRLLRLLPGSSQVNFSCLR